MLSIYLLIAFLLFHVNLYSGAGLYL